MENKKVCLYCGKDLKGTWYFCNFECEVKHTDQLNQQNNDCQHNENETLNVPGTLETFTICHDCGHEL
jgi:hypothetical protein